MKLYNRALRSVKVLGEAAADLAEALDAQQKEIETLRAQLKERQ